MSPLQQNLQRGPLIGIEEAQAGNFPLRDFKIALPRQTPTRESLAPAQFEAFKPAPVWLLETQLVNSKT
jgi:hypothetical protein